MIEKLPKPCPICGGVESIKLHFEPYVRCKTCGHIFDGGEIKR